MTDPTHPSPRPNLVPIYDAAERAMRDELTRWTVDVPEELLLTLSRAVVGTLRDASMLNHDRPWELDDREEPMTDDRGWFADMSDEDVRDPKWPWQPFLQTDGCCFPLPVWFATEAECVDFIRENVAGRGLLEDA